MKPLLIQPCCHRAAARAEAPSIPLPAGKALSFGWEAVPVGTQTPTRLFWPSPSDGDGATRFRIGVALDVRDERRVEVRTGGERGVPLGVFDIRYGVLFQPFELPLSPAQARATARDGIALRLIAGQEPLWIWTGGRDCPETLRPHLLVPGAASPETELIARLDSLACVQPFGWMEGCVLDGLLDLGLTDAARRHLALVIDRRRLRYENHVSVPLQDSFYGIEAGLPFAALARLEPDHPLLEMPVPFWRSRLDAECAALDRQHTSSEGSYTVGYAMAELARARNNDALMRLAFTQARVRQARLFDGNTFWRTRDGDGRRGDRNWARGIGWQLLGLARILTVAPSHPGAADLIPMLRRLAAWVVPLQRADGLWSVFADEPILAPDTAGSAGIAAALAIGAGHGWLTGREWQAAERALAGLKRHLTPDGLLGGASQANKGGEALQRGDYRVLYPTAMGLTAQLMAALRRASSAPPAA